MVAVNMLAITAMIVFMGFSSGITSQFPIQQFRMLFNLAHNGRGAGLYSRCAPGEGNNLQTT
jgi:hypothetical protein